MGGRAPHPRLRDGPDDEAFEATLAAQRRRRRERFEKTVALLRELDLPIDDQLGHLSGSDDDALGRPTVARALIAAGHATTVEDAFRRLLGWGMPAYVPRSGLGPVEAIEAIRAAGGLPSLAHFSEAPTRIEVVRELADAGLGGLEVYYRSFDIGHGHRGRRGRDGARVSCRPAGATTTATPAPTPRRTRACGSRPRWPPASPAPGSV